MTCLSLASMSLSFTAEMQMSYGKDKYAVMQMQMSYGKDKDAVM